MIDASDPAAILRDLEQRARKRFGQHFLHRTDIVARMVRVAKVSPGDRVVEIGPGLGILTHALLQAGADLTAIEIDDILAARFAEVYPQARLIHQDALRVNWAEICPGTGWKVVANLPYNVGTGLVMDLVRQPERFSTLTVMLQAEVVDRFVAEPDSRAYGSLTVQLGARAVARAVFSVPPDSFVPPPKVNSLVAHIEVRPVPDLDGLDPDKFDRVVTAAFSQRRKTIRNSLTSLYTRERAEAALDAAEIDAGVRAEVLDRAQFVALTRALETSAD
jgi:16S rRNA (adenine1518-N6/adenine1519-N6)-dimethyltransferase